MESTRRTTLKIAPLLIAGLVILFQSMGAQKFTSPETGRTERVALSSQEEQALGLQSCQDVLASSEVIGSGPQAEMVHRVAQRIAQATGSAGRDFDWQVSLVNSPQVNAFCLPGSKIVVYTGILPVAQSEAGLATGSQPPEFMSTHPSHGTRIQNLKAFLPRAVEEYEKTKFGRVALVDR